MTPHHTIQQYQQREQTLISLLQQYMPGFTLPPVAPAAAAVNAGTQTDKQLSAKKKWNSADMQQAIAFCKHHKIGIADAATFLNQTA